MASESADLYSQIDSVRSSISECVEDAIRLLRERQVNLNSQLDKLVTVCTEQNDTKESDSKSVDRRDGEFKVPCGINFEWDQNFNRNISELGKLVISTKTPETISSPKRITPDYKAKAVPILSCCRKNQTNTPVLGEFKCAWSLAVEPVSGNIYVTDRSHYCVQVFNSKGEFQFKFSEAMGGPVGICFSGKKLIIAQWGKNYITAHDLEGKLIRKVGKKGSEKGEFHSPWGVASCPVTKRVFVCERENNRVQILTDELEFSSLLGVGMLEEPRDVKLTQDDIYVLDASNLCVHVFNQITHEHVKNYISFGADKLVSNPYFFDLDPDLNLVISDAASHCIAVFSKEGLLVHKIGYEGEEPGGLIEPMGVILDRQGRVYSVCGKNQGCLQIF